MSRRTALAGLALATVAACTGSASAAAPHTVMPGETLWSISAANNLTTRTVAAYNGLAEDASVYTGETIQVPTEAEGASALASASSSATSGGTIASGSAHTVQPGESLSSVAAANGIGLDSLASANGLSGDAFLISGQEITIPAAHGSPTGTSTTTTSGSSATGGGASSDPPPYWTAPVYCPSCPGAEAYLASNAAANWNAMRQASLDQFGIDLYPAGPLSAYRSYGQQLYLYDLYLSGQGALAAAPGTSSHEYGGALDLADSAMADVIAQIGSVYGWAKTEAEDEWWHVNYVGP